MSAPHVQYKHFKGFDPVRTLVPRGNQIKYACLNTQT